MTPGQNKQFRLLIVDDEEPQLNALCNLLRHQGYETVGFANAKSALAALRQSKFDLLLSDFVMPEMDGPSLLRAAFEIDPDLVAILLADQAPREAAANALNAGAIDFIVKAFDLNVILP